MEYTVKFTEPSGRHTETRVRCANSITAISRAAFKLFSASPDYRGYAIHTQNDNYIVTATTDNGSSEYYVTVSPASRKPYRARKPNNTTNIAA